MYSFIPQILIIFAIAGIIIVIVRKIPGVSKLPLLTLLKNAAMNIRRLSIIGLKRLWHYTLQVKELSRRGGVLMHIPKNLPRAFGRSLPHIDLSRRAIKFFGKPNTPEYYLNEAQQYLLHQDYVNAERSYIKAIEKDPHNENAFAALGKLYLSQKKFEEAIETFRFLIKHYPQNDSYHSHLGQAYYNQKRYDRAVAAYEQAIALAPGNAKRYVNLGLTFEAQKKFEEAIKNFERAVDLDKENAQFLMILAEALSRRGEGVRAQAIFEQILILEPTNHLAREKLMQLKF